MTRKTQGIESETINNNSTLAVSQCIVDRNTTAVVGPDNSVPVRNIIVSYNERPNNLGSVQIPINSISAKQA